jgi:DNA-binding NarL/FixJ family response regulator
VKKSEKIRILIADDYYVIRMGVAAIINNEPDMEVVAEATNGAEALELFERVQPDLAVLDMRMPIKDGLKTTIDIRFKFPSARIIMLTAFEGDDEICKALQAGVSGYVFKEAAGEKLIPALRAVVAGQRWIPEEISGRPDSSDLVDGRVTPGIQDVQPEFRGQ